MEEEQQTETVMSASDLAIEELKAEVAALKESHASEVAELKKANAGLWAALHPSIETVPEQPQAPPEGAVFRDTVYRTFGVFQE